MFDAETMAIIIFQFFCFVFSKIVFWGGVSIFGGDAHKHTT